MKKYLMTVALYEDQKLQDHFEKHHMPRGQKYCNYHGIEYIPIIIPNSIPEHCKRRHPYWYRHFLIKYWIDIGFLQDGDVISHIDADICIVNGSWSFEPPPGKSFAYAVDSCNTHCMGAFSFRVTEWSKQLLNNLLDEDRYNKFKGSQFWHIFQDQAAWYSLAGIKSTFADITQPAWRADEDMGWNSTTESNPVYSLEELYVNVEILPVEWNVTSWNGSSPYYRFPTKTGKREDVIFRHFGGATWERKWAEVPIVFNKTKK